MIRPRPTIYQTAVRADEQFLHIPDRYKRPLAHCALCGARLSTYRFPGETRCAPCIQRHTATLTAAELHPIPRGDGYEPCPQCDGAMSTGSRMCRSCRLEATRQ